MCLEVVGDSREEGFTTDIGDELLEDRTALGVGDAVEVNLHVLEVVDGRNDRVGRRQLVLAIRPRLFHRLERGPGVDPLGRLGGGNCRRPLGEGFVEPQVVPPLHRDEVAKPHVCEFVQDGDHSTFANGVGDLRPEHVNLGECHTAGIFHRTGVELGDEKLVVLGKRVRNTEFAFEVFKSLFGDVEDVVVVEELGERLTNVDSQRDCAAVT